MKKTAILLIALLSANSFYSQTYYVANNGNDKYPGTKAKPWKTLHRVNENLPNGSTVKFKRGDVWRGQLVSQTGVTYTADEGSGAKPLFLGSIQGNKRRWYNEGNDIWSMPITTPDYKEMIKNSTFENGLGDWRFHVEPEATASVSCVNESVKITGTNSGNSSNDIQFYIRNLNIQDNTQYKLTFKAKSNATIDAMRILLMQAGSPWHTYSSNIAEIVIDGGIWKEYEYYFDSDSISSNARITFYLGNTGNNWELFLDDISLKKMVTGDEKIKTPSFDEGLGDWRFHVETEATALVGCVNESARIVGTNSGDSFNDIQFYTKVSSIKKNHNYKLTFIAKKKNTNSNNINDIIIKLMQYNSNDQGYYYVYADEVQFSINSTEWKSYEFHFLANAYSYDIGAPRITFYLGDTGNNWDILLDEISFQEDNLDAGNIIFNSDPNNLEFGKKKFYFNKVIDDYDFFSSTSKTTSFPSSTLYMKSETSPEMIEPFEIALNKDIIYQTGKSNVHYSNLNLKYGSTMGIGCMNIDNTTISDCEISYIGGYGEIKTNQNGEESVVRLGNGIQFWGTATNIKVERNHIFEILDAGVTNQDNQDGTYHTNIIYRNNLIQNCDMSFEYWHNSKDSASTTSDIYFVNNTCMYAGDTWAKGQHGRAARHIYLGTDAVNENENSYKVFIKNNIFYETDGYFIQIKKPYSLNIVEFKNNLFFDKEGKKSKFINILYYTGSESLDYSICNGKPVNKNVFGLGFDTTACSDYNAGDPYYGYNDFIDGISDEFPEFIPYELASLIDNPSFDSDSISIKIDSHCIDNGLNSQQSGDVDYFGNERVKGHRVDIGCVEFQNPPTRNPAIATRASTMHEGEKLNLNVEGQNMTMYIFDSSTANVNNPEYAVDRYTILDNNPHPDFVYSHGSKATGVIMSKGLIPTAKGIAPKSKVIGSHTYGMALFQNDEILTPDIDKVSSLLSTNENILVSSNFYGNYYQFISDWKIGAYLNVSKKWDLLMYEHPNYLMVTAAGNSGTDPQYNDFPMEQNSHYDKLVGNKTSKNNIVVANIENVYIDNNTFEVTKTDINSYTSQGPTDDYRIKPDISGIGKVYSTTSTIRSYDDINGTSMATPGVATTLLLLQQHYHNLNGNYMKAATLKGLALHTADDVTSNQGGEEALEGPDAITGWGLINAMKAAETISNDGENSLILELTLDEGDIYSITVHSDNISPLIASISWTDPPGVVSTIANSTIPVLVNDLNIKAKKGKETYYPYRMVSVNSNSNDSENIVDPFERIDIPDAGGSYNIIISHNGILQSGSQDYSLIITGIQDVKIEKKKKSLTSISNVKMNNPRDNSFLNTNLVIYPNPSKSVVYLHLVDDSFINSEIQIFNMNGVLFHHKKYSIDASEYQINLSTLPKGIYVIKVNTNKGGYSGKVAIY